MNKDPYQLFAELAEVSELYKQTVQHYIGLELILFFIALALLPINKALHNRLFLFAILPRRPFGLMGLVGCPFLHGHFSHLLFNAFPFFFLCNLIAMQGGLAWWHISLFISVVGGLFVWLIGRPQPHAGSSLLIMGYFGYCIMFIYSLPPFLSVVIGGFMALYFGRLVLSLLPGDKQVSWEAHLGGFIAGVIFPWVDSHWLGMW